MFGFQSFFFCKIIEFSSRIFQFRTFSCFSFLFPFEDASSDVIERVNEIYTAVVQSEECMEKIACEVGALAGDVGLTRNPALK